MFVAAVAKSLVVKDHGTRALVFMSEDIGQTSNENKESESRGNKAEDHSKTFLKIVIEFHKKKTASMLGPLVEKKYLSSTTNVELPRILRTTAKYVIVNERHR